MYRHAHVPHPGLAHAPTRVSLHTSARVEAPTLSLYFSC